MSNRLPRPPETDPAHIRSRSKFYQSPGFLLYDDFERADTVAPDIGAPVIGDPWTLVGSGGGAPTDGRILSGRFQTAVDANSSNTYAVNSFSRTPRSINAGVVWTASGGTGACGTATLSVCNKIYPVPWEECVHVRFSRTVVAIDIRPSTGFLYDPSPASIASLALGTVHEIKVEMDPTEGIVRAYVNGVMVHSRDIGAWMWLWGNHAYWQIWYTDADTTDKVEYEWVSALSSELGLLHPLQLVVPRGRRRRRLWCNLAPLAGGNYITSGRLSLLRDGQEIHAWPWRINSASPVASDWPFPVVSQVFNPAIVRESALLSHPVQPGSWLNRHVCLLGGGATALTHVARVQGLPLEFIEDCDRLRLDVNDHVFPTDDGGLAVGIQMVSD